MAILNKIKIFFLRIFSVVLFYLFLLFFTALFVFSVHTYIAFKHSDSMTIEPDTIEVDGNVMVSRSDILLLASLDKPVSYMDVSSEEIERSLSTHPWIKEALVTTLPPDSLKIFIEEYKPKALVNSIRKDSVSRLWFSDDKGFMFKRLFPGEKGIAHLPLIGINTTLTSKQRVSVILTALAFIDRWNSEESLCVMTAVHFSLVDGFSAICSSGKELTTELRFGSVAEEDAHKVAKILYNKFASLSVRYFAKKQWVGEYVFDKQDTHYRVIVGKIKEVVSHVEE